MIKPRRQPGELLKSLADDLEQMEDLIVRLERLVDSAGLTDEKRQSVKRELRSALWAYQYGIEEWATVLRALDQTVGHA